MRVIGIDPGPEVSALVEWKSPVLGFHLFEANHSVLRWLAEDAEGGVLVVERVTSYGRPVGQAVFETVFWSGRFVEAWRGPWARLTFRDVARHHCHTSCAKEGCVRQALLDRYGSTRQAAVGRKDAPGPLYGISGHLWSALALAVAYAEGQREGA